MPDNGNKLPYVTNGNLEKQNFLCQNCCTAIKNRKYSSLIITHKNLFILLFLGI